MWFDCTKTALIKLKVAYKTTVRDDLLACHGTTVPVKCLSTLTSNHSVNCFEFLYTNFVQGLLYLGILCCEVFAIVHIVFIQSYGLGGEHFCMFICDWPHTYIL